MDIKLAYGRGGLVITLDQNLAPVVFRKMQNPGLAEPGAAVQQALANPLGTPHLRAIAHGKQTAIIVINDITRPVPNKILLPPIIDELHWAGLTDGNIALINATGTHRAAPRAEQVELVGEDILARHPFLNHDCHNDSQHLYLGSSPGGTEVFLDKRYMEADVKILTGLIEPHFMAGYSGGRKALCPGLASIKTVRAIHHPRFMEAPRATNLVVHDNPLHRELSSIVRMAGVDFIANVVINERREVCGVFCGDVDEAHLAGVAFARDFDVVRTAGRFDVVITTSAGYPLDRTYYQAVKGMCGVEHILKPGGTIIIAAECEEGMGNEVFLDCLRVRARFATHEEYIRHIERHENFMPDQWQVEKLSQALRNGRVVLVAGGLSAEDHALTLAERADSVEQAIGVCLQKYGPGAKIAVVPEGPYVIPTTQGA